MRKYVKPEFFFTERAVSSLQFAVNGSDAHLQRGKTGNPRRGTAASMFPRVLS